ncbi:IS256 family transposase, partial [Paenibacillus arenosi]
VREDGRVRSRAVMIAAGINEKGTREILGLQIGDTESEASWDVFFMELKQRGLDGVDLITSDQHGGLVKAVRTHFQGVTWQRCQTHFMRNILDASPKALRPEIKAHARTIFEAANEQIGRELLEKTIATFIDKAPKAMQVMEEGFDDATAVLALPADVRVRTRTTNAIERLNGELRRRERVIRIFPNRDSVLRLFGALLMEQDDKWTTGKKYVDLNAYHTWRRPQTK